MLCPLFVISLHRNFFYLSARRRSPLSSKGRTSWKLSWSSHWRWCRWWGWSWHASRRTCGSRRCSWWAHGLTTNSGKYGEYWYKYIYKYRYNQTWPGELDFCGEDGVGHQQLLWRPAEEEGCDHHEDQFENLLWKDQLKVAIGFQLILAQTFCKPFCVASFKLNFKFKIKLDWIKIIAQTFGLNFSQTFFFARAWGVWTPVLSPGAEKKYLIMIVFI